MDIFDKASVTIYSPAPNIYHMFNLRLCSLLSIRSQKCCGTTPGVPFVTPLMNQLQLTYYECEKPNLLSYCTCVLRRIFMLTVPLASG